MFLPSHLSHSKFERDSCVPLPSLCRAPSLSLPSLNPREGEEGEGILDPTEGCPADGIAGVSDSSKVADLGASMSRRRDIGWRCESGGSLPQGDAVDAPGAVGEWVFLIARSYYCSSISFLFYCGWCEQTHHFSLDNITLQSSNYLQLMHAFNDGGLYLFSISNVWYHVLAWTNMVL